MVIRPVVTLLLLSVLVMGCESKRIPSTCISFDAKEDQSKLIREGAARIAASRRMDFSDKSGQYPWPDLTIYIGLEGRGFHVIGHRETGYVGTLCFYEEKGIFGGEKATEQMKLVQADFSVFFIDAMIPFEAGKPRSQTKSGTGGTPMGRHLSCCGFPVPLRWPTRAILKSSCELSLRISQRRKA
jgi:hypothetical protein